MTKKRYISFRTKNGYAASLNQLCVKFTNCVKAHIIYRYVPSVPTVYQMHELYKMYQCVPIYQLCGNVPFAYRFVPMYYLSTNYTKVPCVCLCTKCLLNLSQMCTKCSDVPIVYRCCLLYTSPSPRDAHESRMPSSA